MDPKEIIKQIAEKNGMTVLSVLGKGKLSEIVKVRKEIIAVLNLMGLSASSIGRIMGYKNHTNVLYHLRKMKRSE